MKTFNGEITLKINNFFAENEEEATQIINRYITSLANTGNRSLSWDEVDWDLREEEV